MELGNMRYVGTVRRGGKEKGYRGVKKYATYTHMETE
jgi:hypothetical protein